jgi:3-mercaptopyruvate sulfurtransferase SseA
MQKLKPLIVLPLLLLATLACNLLIPLPETGDVPTQAVEPSAAVTIPLTEAEVPRVTAEDAKAAFDNDTAIIVDVRSQESYATSHVAGALSIPLGEFETNIASIDLPKDKWIITYCT